MSRSTRRSILGRVFGGAAVLVCACACFESSSHAQAIKVSPQPSEAGSFRTGRVSISIPAPAPELLEMGPDLRVLMEPLAAAKLRLIAAFILSDNLAQLPGSTTPLTKYALVEVPRAAEFMDVDEATFKTVVDGMNQQFSSGNLQSTMQTEIDRHFADLGAGKLTVDKPTQLGTMFSKPNVSGFAMLMPMAVKDKSVTLVAATLVVRVRNRLLFAYLYTQYKDKASVDWVTQTSESWADAILKSNEP
ncbi:MAG TPA: hypothetical protein VK574_05880 [Terracidiphilus sp.]|nr:hypothetical protein [Terracidiphilus sp.]